MIKSLLIKHKSIRQIDIKRSTVKNNNIGKMELTLKSLFLNNISKMIKNSNICCPRLVLSTISKNTFVLILILFFSLNNLKAQDSVKVKGVVLSSYNQGIANILVSIEGSNELPVITNEEGEFELANVSPNDYLLFAPPDFFKPKRINVNGRTVIKLFLTPNDIASGDDAIDFLGKSVPGKNMVAAYSDLNTSNIDKTKSQSVDQYMQGKVAGMYVANISSLPGSGAVTMLRGLNSLYANTQPLYIVDGVPVTPHNLFESNINGFFFNPLLGINPFDISKVTVIKDPAITAAYGSKASNGLILLKTLDPSATQTIINLEMRTGFSQSPDRLIPQLNATQHKTLISEMLISSGMLEEDIIEKYPILNLEQDDPRFIDYQHNTNWQKQIFNNSSFSNINLNVKGGDEIARYGLSFGYTADNGIIKTTNYQGYNLRFVGTLNIFKWLRMNTSVSIVNNNLNFKESAIVPETSPILTSLAKSPLLNPYKYDANAQEINELTEVDELGVSNPVAIINGYVGKNINNEFNSSLGLEASISRNLVLSTIFGLDFNVLKENIFMPNKGMQSYDNLEAINVAQASNNSFNSLFNNINLQYNKEINDNHQFSLSTGVNLWSNKFQFDWGLTRNASPNDQYRRLQDGINNLRELGGQNRDWNWISYYENMQYSFSEKYIINATINIDGSSRIGDNAANTINIGGLPFGLFYSGGFAWLLSKESLFKGISWLDLFKIRGSIGKTGNDDIGEINARNYYDIVRYRQTVGLYPATIYNDELSYEEVIQYDGGLDIAFLGHRFSLTMDIYKKNIDNMLIYSKLEPYFGYSFRPENNGSMENTGWEVSGFFRLINNRSFKWDVETNLSTVKNTVTSIIGNQLITPIEGGEIVNMTGFPSNSFYGYKFLGVFSNTTEAINANLYNDKGNPYQAGDAIFADLSGPNGVPDGTINDFDKTILGSALPEFFGGIVNTFRYKNWSLSGFIQFVEGNKIFNYVRYKNEQMTGLQNQNIRTLDRWQYEGHMTEIPRANWNDPTGNSAFSDRWIEDGSYIRLKNLTLCYEIPNQFLVFRNAKFFASANNLWTFSRYLGYDPEVAYSYSPLGQGVDYGLAPQSRSFIFGINLGL